MRVALLASLILCSLVCSPQDISKDYREKLAIVGKLRHDGGEVGLIEESMKRLTSEPCPRIAGDLAAVSQLIADPSADVRRGALLLLSVSGFLRQDGKACLAPYRGAIEAALQDPEETVRWRAIQALCAQRPYPPVESMPVLYPMWPEISRLQFDKAELYAKPLLAALVVWSPDSEPVARTVAREIRQASSAGDSARLRLLAGAVKGLGATRRDRMLPLPIATEWNAILMTPGDIEVREWILEALAKHQRLPAVLRRGAARIRDVAVPGSKIEQLAAKVERLAQ